ncbi:MAG: protein kinase [Phycisphaera sp.]|nr:protein kinase [Phycisphaera sp.]
MATTRANKHRTRNPLIPRPGDVKHGFRILSRLGPDPDRGIFLAAHATRGDLVVLKQGLRNAGDGSFERIQREHEVLSGLDDPRIRPSLRIHRGREGLRTTEVVLVARFIDGSDFEELSGRGLQVVLDAAIDLAGCLSLVHEKGIVHGRLDSSHVLVTPGDGRRLIGFGSSVEAGVRFDSSTAGSGFVAPERHLGGVATARTDVFGLAATLWAVLGGGPLQSGFEADLDAAGWMARHRAWEKSVNGAGLPDELAALLVRCLHPDPRRRPALMESLATSLGGIPVVGCSRSSNGEAPVSLVIPADESIAGSRRSGSSRAA